MKNYNWITLDNQTTSYTDEFAELINQLSTKFGYPYVDLYITKDDEVLGVLITSSKELIEKFMEIEIQSCKESANMEVNE